MEVHITVSTSNSVRSRQTAVIFSLQNMQYIHWHLQATFKKGKIKMNLKGKNFNQFQCKNACWKWSTDPKQKQNRNSLIIKCLSLSGVRSRFKRSINLPARLKATNLLLLCFVNICGLWDSKASFSPWGTKKQFSYWTVKYIYVYIITNNITISHVGLVFCVSMNQVVSVGCKTKLQLTSHK